MKITRVGRWAGIAVLGMFMFLAALPPAARAQIVPVSLVHETAVDSEIPHGVMLAPLPQSELRRAVKPALPKSFWVVTAGVYMAAGLDMQRSESMLPDFDESDPIVRPFLRLRRRITLPPRCLPQESTFWDGKWRGPSAGTRFGGCRRSRPWQETWRDTDTRRLIRLHIDVTCCEDLICENIDGDSLLT